MTPLSTPEQERMTMDKDLPGYIFLDESRPRAQKHYSCAICHELIKKGSIHVRLVYMDEAHKMKNVRHHLKCEGA